jgi:2-methylcitrate dehydratase PrpD
LKAAQAGKSKERRVPESIALELGQYADDFNLSSLPPAALHEARRCFVNFVGCAIGGLSHEMMGMTASALLPFGGPATATVIGRRVRTDPLTAAVLNGASASVQSYDDCHLEAVIHPGAPIGAACLALGETKDISGAEFLAAFAIGVETICRLSKALSVTPAASNIAWYQTGVCGGVAAAVAAGRILRLTSAQMESAIGIAVSQASGSRVIQGSMCILFLAGHEAQVGVRAALLAQQGFQSPSQSIEGRYGFYEMFSLKPHSPSLIADFATRHEILALDYKFYPCGIVLRPIIDACLRLRERCSASMDHIKSVDV